MSSTSGMIEMLAIIVINHCAKLSDVKLNIFWSGAMVLTPTIESMRTTNEILNAGLLNTLILKILWFVLQFIA